MKLRGLSAYLILASGFIIAIGLYQHHVDQRIEHNGKLACDYATFTRATQRGVIAYIRRQADVVGENAVSPEIKAFSRASVPTLKALAARTEPPPCARDGN